MKRMIVLLLVGVMMFTPFTHAYAAEYGCDFAAVYTDIYTRSYSPTWYAHLHEYTLNIKAVKDDDNSNYKMVVSTRRHHTWTDNYETRVYPSTYNDGKYVGKYFKGQQICNASIPELSLSKKCIADVKCNK